MGHAAVDVPRLLLTLIVLLVLARLLGWLAQRIGQPAVLGELVAGILLGGSVFGLLDPGVPAIHALAELGVLILLFEIGLHTDVRSLASVGGTATAVAVVGVALPFAAGWAAALALGLTQPAALVCGAALTATSVGISARVLGDLGVIDKPEGRVVLGAAVLDDIIGLVILAIVSSSVAGGDVNASGVARSAGSAMIIAAFAAGLVVHATRRRATIEKATTWLGHFFVPIFFASVGAAVDLDAFARSSALLLGATLATVGIVGKVAAGYAPIGFTGNKLLVGVAMVPRGEVGLIFAQMGLASGAIDATGFGAIMLMVLVTTFVTPPALARIARRTSPPMDTPGDGGIDDLVAGTRRPPTS